jgi:hypothetical protein
MINKRQQKNEVGQYQRKRRASRTVSEKKVGLQVEEKMSISQCNGSSQPHINPNLALQWDSNLPQIRQGYG